MRLKSKTAFAVDRTGRYLNHYAAAAGGAGGDLQKYGVLFYTDATASLAGNALETDAWGLDAVSAGMQKCLGGPSGTSPITLSDEMAAVIRQRKCVEQGSARMRTRMAMTR